MRVGMATSRVERCSRVSPGRVACVGGVGDRATMRARTSGERPDGCARRAIVRAGVPLGRAAVLLLPFLLLGGCEEAGPSSLAGERDRASGAGVRAEPVARVEAVIEATRDPRPFAEPGPGVRADFVGSRRCATCHPAESARWRGSHHDRAMEAPTRDSLEGDFDAIDLRVGDDRYGFDRVGDDLYVTRQEGGSEVVDRRQVVATFGVTPLQQVLVTGQGGRLHAWPIAWDARPANAGGARWYALVDESPSALPEDPLHVDGPAFEWNAQCASCHSTDLRKAFDVEANTYATTWAEMDVGCEACHGPGQAHVSWAELAESDRAPVSAAVRSKGEVGLVVRFDPWSPEAWQRENAARIASRVQPLRFDQQLEICAPCHSRRATLLDPAPVGTAFLDGHAPRLMEAGLYFDDGAIRDEVYVWGSFMQSRMAAAGVRCSDCHDPHALTLRREGNALCHGCHAPEVFDAPAHRGHADSEGPGTGCIDCHMPARTYMGVDARRDHAFSMPRPARSEALGAPDACRGCHVELTVEEAEATLAGWRGQRPAKANWADRLVVGGRARWDAQRWAEVALAVDSPDIVRGGAWRRFAEEASSLADRAEIARRFEQGGPLERLGLIDLARRLTGRERARLLAPLLEDSRRAIRIASAEALSEEGTEGLRPAERSALGRALREYRAAQEANGERPESGTHLALLALRQGDRALARALLERTVERAPYFVPARVNLADLARLEGDENEAIHQLREALLRVPGDVGVRRAYAFALHRSGDREGALVELERAHRDAPADASVALAYALALDGVGRREQALAELAEALDRGLDAPDLHHAMVSLALSAGRVEVAQSRLAAWRAAHPDDPRLPAASGAPRVGP